MRNMKRVQQGFTLIELMIVIAIVAILVACLAGGLYAAAITHPKHEKMSTTMVAAYLDGFQGLLHLGHAGDSRAYLVRAGAISADEARCCNRFALPPGTRLHTTGFRLVCVRVQAEVEKTTID